MLRLYHNNRIDEQMVEDLEFIDHSITDAEIQLQIASRLLNLGIIELCQHIFCKKSFNNKIFDIVDDDLTVGTRAVLTCLGCVVNLTDISKDMCHRVIEVGFHEDILNLLNLDSVDPSKVEFDYMRSRLVDSAMSVIYNAIQVSWLPCLFFPYYLYIQFHLKWPVFPKSLQVRSFHRSKLLVTVEAIKLNL